MSAPLPQFRKGEPLQAAQMAALACRIRELQRRQTDGTLNHTVGFRRVLPGRAFAFELAEKNGVIWHRVGWVELAGKLTRVGDAEWTPLGGVRPCTIWLEMELNEGQLSAAVTVGELDLTTPETNLRRRLGYVRTEEGADGGTLWHCIQVLGGMVSPTAPRRQMGTAYPDEPAQFRKSDTGWMYQHAGSEPGTRPQPVQFGYACELGEMMLPDEYGGRRFAQVMAFATNI